MIRVSEPARISFTNKRKICWRSFTSGVCARARSFLRDPAYESVKQIQRDHWPDKESSLAANSVFGKTMRLEAQAVLLFWLDILSGTAGCFSAGPGYDFVIGVGSDQGLEGK